MVASQIQDGGTRRRRSHPTVSIVIPVLNEAACIGRAVERAWGLAPHEVIGVDGGSEDATVELAEAAGARVLHSAKGRAAQQNFGAREAGGDVLLFLHADTWLETGAAEQIAEALGDPNVQGGAFRQRIDAEGALYRLLERGNASRVVWRRMPYGDQGIFMRRAMFERLGGFPELPLMEDVQLMTRFRRIAKPVLLPGPIHVSARRWEQNGVVRQTLRNWTLLTAYRLGVSPKSLAAWYPANKNDGL